MKRWLSIFVMALLLSGGIVSMASAEGEILEQEPNNSFEEAHSILNDAKVKGSLTENDQDYFKIEIKEKSYFSIYGTVEGRQDQIEATFYDSNFNQLIDNEVYQGSVVFYDKVVHEPGTYYIKVTDYQDTISLTENYTIQLFVITPEVKRIWGSDRYETAVAIAYFERDYATQIFLATGEDFPDALAVAPLAFRTESPVLLTRSKELPESVKRFIKNQRVKKVTIVGGTGAVSQEIENYLRNTLGLEVVRLGGKDRFETAVKIGEQVSPGPFKPAAIVVNGRNFPDAVSIAPQTAYRPAPILLTDTHTLPKVTADFIKPFLETYVIGGTGAVSESVLNLLPSPIRIGGKNRYETSVAIAEYFKPSGPQSAVVTTGENFPDALTASSIAGIRSQPIILTPPAALHPSVKDYFQSNEVLWYTIIGGTGAVSNTVEQEIWSLVK